MGQPDRLKGCCMVDVVSGVDRRPRWKSVAAGVLALVSVLALGSGCAKGEFSYVANKDAKTYYKVPSGWTEVDPGSINDFFVGQTFHSAPDSQFATDFRRVSWTHAYDQAEQPTGDHLISLYPTEEPVTYALVTPVPSALQQELSFNMLRNLFLPVSDELRAAAAQNDALLPGFELLDDEILTRDGGLHGIRVVYNYLFPSQVTHTFDLTALINQDASMLYMFIIRCSATCYRTRSVEFNNVATSFTVGSKA
jgi:hypothetical protein